MPPAFTKSPTLNGWNKINSTPAAKLLNDPCSARPTARPAAATTAANEVVSTPNRLTAATTTNASRPQYTRFERNMLNVSSILPRAITFRSNRRAIFAAQRPTTKIASAASRFSPTSTPFSARNVTTWSQTTRASSTIPFWANKNFDIGGAPILANGYMQRRYIVAVRTRGLQQAIRQIRDPDIAPTANTNQINRWARACGLAACCVRNCEPLHTESKERSEEVSAIALGAPARYAPRATHPLNIRFNRSACTRSTVHG